MLGVDCTSGMAGDGTDMANFSKFCWNVHENVIIRHIRLNVAGGGNMIIYVLTGALLR